MKLDPIENPNSFDLAKYDTATILKELLNRMITLADNKNENGKIGAYPINAGALLREALLTVNSNGFDYPVVADIIDAEFVQSEAEFLAGDATSKEETAKIVKQIATVFNNKSPSDLIVHQSIRLMLEGSI